MLNTQPITLSHARTQFIVWTMLCIMPIIGMCIDLIAPSLPAIAQGLKISNAMAKNTVSIYLLGFCLGNFFSGFLADAWGRAKIMRTALLIFTVVSAIPLVFPHIIALLLSRLLQGLAIGTASVVLRAICSDVLSPDGLIKLGPWFGTMWGFGPVFGPVLGGYLQVYFGWQAGFYFFSIVSLIICLVVWFGLPETHFNRHPLEVAHIKKNISEILHHRLFLGIAAVMGLTYSLIILFNVSGPFLIQVTLHHSPIFFGHVAFWLGVVFLLTTISIRLLLKKYSVEKLWLVNINSLFAAGIIFLCLSYFFLHSMWLIAVASAVMFLGCGAIFPISLGKGLSLFRYMAGTATAVMYLINIGITSLCAYLAGFIHVRDAFILMWLYMTFVFLVVLIYWTILRKQQ